MMRSKPILLTTLLLLTMAITVSAAPDAGSDPLKIWQPQAVDPTGCRGPSLALNSAGRPFIAYNHHGELKITWQDGAIWDQEIVDDQPGATGFYPALAFDAQDAPHITFYAPYDETLKYAHKQGATWQITSVTPTYDPAGGTAIALDGDGNPRIAFWDQPNKALKYTYHDGQKWREKTIATMTGSGQNVSLDLALDSTDQPHLCYYDFDKGALWHAAYDGASWQKEAVDDDVFYNGQKCAIAIDQLDRPHISFRDLGLYYAARRDSSWDIQAVDEAFFAGNDAAIALDAFGRPHISYAIWTETELHELRYAYSDSRHWWIEIPDEIRVSSRIDNTSLALDTAGTAHIAYCYGLNPEQLKYVRRGAAAEIYEVELPLVVTSH